MSTDELIVRQVAFKGAIETLTRLPTVPEDLDALVSVVAVLTNEFERIIWNKSVGKPATDDQPDECPKHHKAQQGKYGPYCPTKLADGTWCTWRPDK